MSKRAPKARLFLEGGGMVTGTHDKLEAQRLIIDERLDELGAHDDPYEILYLLRLFNLADAKLETGRMVPAGPDNWEGYSWFWRPGYALGKAGVTRAVVWHG